MTGKLQVLIGIIFHCYLSLPECKIKRMLQTKQPEDSLLKLQNAVLQESLKFYQFLKALIIKKTTRIKLKLTVEPLWEMLHNDVLNPCPAPGAVCSMGVAELAGIVGAGTRGRSNCLVDLGQRRVNKQGVYEPNPKHCKIM